MQFWGEKHQVCRALQTPGPTGCSPVQAQGATEVGGCSQGPLATAAQGHRAVSWSSGTSLWEARDENAAQTFQSSNEI